MSRCDGLSVFAVVFRYAHGMYVIQSNSPIILSRRQLDLMKAHIKKTKNRCQLYFLISLLRLTRFKNGAIHSTKIPTGPTGKSVPPQKVDLPFRNFSSWTEPIHWVLDLKFPEILVRMEPARVLTVSKAAVFTPDRVGAKSYLV